MAKLGRGKRSDRAGYLVKQADVGVKQLRGMWGRRVTTPRDVRGLKCSGGNTAESNRGMGQAAWTQMPRPIRVTLCLLSEGLHWRHSARRRYEATTLRLDNAGLSTVAGVSSVVEAPQSSADQHRDSGNEAPLCRMLHYPSCITRFHSWLSPVMLRRLSSRRGALIGPPDGHPSRS
jgi:hypothetical protein